MFILYVYIGIFKLGFLTIFFSNAMINSYTIGVAVHVFSSQVNHILGYKVKSYPGLFKLIYVSKINKQLVLQNTRMRVLDI